MQEINILLVRNNNHKLSSMKLYLFIQLFMVGALLQGFGSVLGAASQNSNISKSLQAQVRENEKNRQYNLQLAKMQNEWNLQQWERENEYNNPLNQMARLKAAGLNPNLVYGNGAGQSTSAPSPNLTSGAPSSPVDMSLLAQRPTVGQIMSDALQNEMTRAQIDKIKAETRTEGYQGDILKSDAAFRDAINQGTLDLNNVQINGINSKIKLNDSQISEIRSKISNLDAQTKNLVAEYDKIRAYTRNLDASTVRTRLLNVLDSEKARYEIRELSSRASLNDAQAKKIVESLSLELLGLQAQRDESLARAGNLRASTSRIEFDLSQDKDYQDIERTTNIVTDICDTMAPIANLIGAALGGNQYEEHYHETKVDKNGDVSERYGSRKRK